eukprot:2899363-Pyramimonas_sp.AAC.1
MSATTKVIPSLSPNSASKCATQPASKSKLQTLRYPAVLRSPERQDVPQPATKTLLVAILRPTHFSLPRNWA